jgi:hypothetical protein
VPVNVTVWGDPFALSVMFSVAVNEPAAVGAKMTWAEQDWPLVSSLPPQVLVWVNRLAFVPVLLITTMCSMPLPELLMVSGSVLVEPAAVEGKLSEVADRWATGPAVAVPVNVTVCGELAALSVMLKVAEKLPAAVGVKMIWAEQDWPLVSSLPPQVLVWVKRLALVPVLLITTICSMPLPELVMVTGSVLVEPTCVEGKLNEVAESFAIGPATAVPVSATVCGEFPALSVTFRVAENEPAAVGVKVTWAVHDLPGAIGLPPQLLVWLNRLALVPVWLIALTLRVAVPELVMVRGSVVVEPSCVEEKLSEVVESVTAGAAVE